MNTAFIDIPTLIHGDRVTWSLDEEGNIALRSTYGPGVTVYLEPEDVAAQAAAQAAWRSVQFLRANAPSVENHVGIDLSVTVLARGDRVVNEETGEVFGNLPGGTD